MAVNVQLILELRMKNSSQILYLLIISLLISCGAGSVKDDGGPEDPNSPEPYTTLGSSRSPILSVYAPPPDGPEPECSRDLINSNYNILVATLIIKVEKNGEIEDWYPPQDIVNIEGTAVVFPSGGNFYAWMEIIIGCDDCCIAKTGKYGNPFFTKRIHFETVADYNKYYNYNTNKLTLPVEFAGCLAPCDDYSSIGY